MEVRLDADMPNALAGMLAEKIETSMARPGASRKARRSGKVSLRALDIGLAATVEFAPEAVTVRNGASKGAQVRLRSDAASLIAVADAPSVMGVPNPFTAAGRDALVLLARRRVRVGGALRHPLVLVRFSRLMAAG